eukprot:TRINITY_DN74144_c0_g1_i1.p2 TRINITY_DN74144_c0_g1~~TRINITY_DN74144_c0_g1_i1.p2  ORF type:complete len:196 (-),score=80.71 TRINITY_DN74144_c0_g1_i1:71-658(-)
MAFSKMSLSLFSWFAVMARAAESNAGDKESLLLEHDSNGDGKLSLEEVTKSLHEEDMPEAEKTSMLEKISSSFKSADANSDGALTTDEMDSFMNSFTEEDSTAKAGDSQEGYAGVSSEEAEELLHEHDTDGDKALSLAEITATVEEEMDEAEKTELLGKIGKHFDKADGNRDGKLSLAEMGVFMDGFAKEAKDEV